MINNSALIQEIRDVGKLQAGKDKIPNELGDKVIPVIDVNPKHARRVTIIKNAVASNTTSATLLTTDANMDFYLTNAHLSMIKDATATSINTDITVVLDGATVQIVRIVGLTLTAQMETVIIAFPFPIKVDRGSAIALVNNTGNANITSRATIMGYYDEQSKG